MIFSFSAKRKTRTALSAFIAGLLCGLLGTGGGAVLLRSLCKNEKEERLPMLFATCAASVLPLSILSFGICLAKSPSSGILSVPSVSGAVLGGAAGAFFLSKLPGKITGRIFSGMLLLGGILSLVRL